MIHPIIISHVQTQRLLQARQNGEQTAQVSPDLELTSVEVAIKPNGASFPSGELLGWDAIEEITASENNCFAIQDGELNKIMIFSELTNQLFSLMPTTQAPTMLISGIPMHRIKNTDPYNDTLEKIKAIKPISGQVLDTATGLGYTAIQAAQTADHVTTIELDPAALQVARLNPWSRDLFDNPKITQRIGDSYDIIKEFEAGAFNCIIHDPPAFNLAGDLYSSEFYGELYRIMRRGGKLFHYIGNPDSKSGHTITRGVMRRLQAAGFSISRSPRAFGVVAFK